MTNAPHGTHFSDGIRTGTQFIAALKGPGLPNSPYYEYVVTPLTLATNNIALAQTPIASSYLTLTAGTGVTAVTYNGLSVLQLDCQRGVSITGGSGTTSQTIVIYGMDLYGQLIQETVTGPTGATTAYSKNTYTYIYKVHVGAGTTGTIAIGTSDVFGLPFALPSASNLMTATWAPYSGALLSGIVTLGSGTATVTNTAIVSTSLVMLTRNTPGGTVGNLSVPTASIVANTSFVINSDSNIDASTVAWQILPNSYLFTPAYTGTTSATTGDVRGTVQVSGLTGMPAVASNGTNVLSVQMYLAQTANGATQSKVLYIGQTPYFSAYL